ncbi:MULTISPECIES: DUF4132 domain-containing protein [unclassified Modicisalibacter]|uniref:DUF4132 domain-containing protein n=1 Tax=unclassified Modicisalibacter TaxID=2679913 RepID=UPI001CCBF5C0|nr:MULTISPECIES: DUF4132 domain-containing protein [unclassified Modicisalibacter]MBZ9558922.1 DUF4132 domain-containing protein [Modicisalibacter sp. R2A 31.J]MBZ9575186.1 DUF4132 domain-containing protein [Modicisalibacter sp. MOD 31.J]
MFKTLQSLFGRFQNPLNDICDAPSGLSETDRAALVEDLGHANSLEPGLGDDLARYVVIGAPETALLRLTDHVKANAKAVSETLLVKNTPAIHWQDTDAAKQTAQEVWNRRAPSRAHLLVRLEGWDAPAVQRFASVLAVIAPVCRYHSHGEDIESLPGWLNVYLQEARRFILSRPVHDILGSRQREVFAPAAEDFAASTHSVARLLALFALADLPEELLYRLIYPHGARRTEWQFLTGLDDFMRAKPEHFAAAIDCLDADSRQDILRLALERDLMSDERAGPAYQAIALRAAGDTSAGVRNAAIALFRVSGIKPAPDLIEATLRKTSAGERKPAILVLAALGDPASLRMLAEHALHETSPALKRDIDAALLVRETLDATAPGASREGRAEDGPDGYHTHDGRLIAPPPPQPRDATRVADDVRDELTALIEAVRDQAKADHAQRAELKKRQSKPFDEPFETDAVDLMVALLRDELREKSDRQEAGHYFFAPLRFEYGKARELYRARMKRILARQDISLEALTRIGLAARESRRFFSEFLDLAFNDRYHSGTVADALLERLRKGDDLRRVIAEIERADIDFREYLANAIDNAHISGRETPEPVNETVWAALLPYLDLLDQQFLRRHNQSDDERALGLMRLFPELPGRFLEAVLSRAGDSDPGIKTSSRALLAPIGGLTPIIAQGLTDGKAKSRADAAQWLAERGYEDALPPLLAAAEKEKDVAAKAAILKALVRLGHDVSTFFSREALQEEAEKGLAKTRVDYSELFDPDDLPVLHWAGGERVDATLVKWWFARAHKLKAPGGDPLLRMALERLERTDAQRLGQTVFNAWIAFDTVHPSSEAADAEASEQAAEYAAWRQRSDPTYTEAMAHAEIRREVLARMPNSAHPHRGLLALCCLMPAAEMARIGRRYLKNHGKRAPQCRAILEAMAANPDPVVVQALLDVAKRHKQPGGRRLAGELVDRIAEEQDWTREEMADRVVPTAGVDESGVLDLTIGDKAYAARLVEDDKLTLKLQILNPQGRPVGSLPTIKPDPDAPAPVGGGEDEATQAKSAKKLLSDARKELKQTVENQKARLFESMCTERRWTKADFEAFILEHPIMSRLAQRLVFEGRDAQGDILCLFRPMDDGTLTDAEDEPVDLDTLSHVSIAHRMTAGDAMAAAWDAHLDDYEVTPLFEQFTSQVEIDDPNATEIRDREGWLISLSAMRSNADKLGWRRGPVEDGGVFSTYERHFPGVALAAVITFKGDLVGDAVTLSSLTALESLCFVRMRGNDALAYARPLALVGVPAVMLAEALGDYHALAAAGIGHDPDWQNKTWC